MYTINKKFGKILVAIAATGLWIFVYSLFLILIKGTYANDFPLHINTVIKGNAQYSLMHRLIGICYRLPHSETALAALMSALIVGTALGIYRYLYVRIGNIDPQCLLALTSIALIFTSNLYIPIVFPHFYNHYTIVSQPWHNSTYILMRFFSVFVVHYYFIIYDQVKKNKFQLKDGMCFCLLLSLCNYAKPNFFLAFAPASLVVFLYMLIVSKGKNIISLFKWGCCYLLSMPCLFYMVNIVYDESEQSSISISTKELDDYLFGNMATGGYGNQLLICEISNLAFPIFVLIVFFIIYKRNRTVEFERIVQGFFLFFIAHMEQLLLVDVGPRQSHGNYAWGVYCAGMILFLICIGEWFLAYKKKQLSSRLLFNVGITLFALHMICGMVYFAKLFNGPHYIM